MPKSSSFTFSHRPNRAHEIQWREWGQAAFDNATALDRPVLLNLTASWCEWCQQMDEGAFSDVALIEFINRELVPVRVDADRYPHVQDRYIAGGWPTNAFLTPTGEVLWSGTYMDAAALRRIADGVLQAWREQRASFEEEVSRRRRAMEAARSRQPSYTLVRREAADDVITALREGFDPRNGGFGEAPRFPPTEAIELLYRVGAYGDAALADMADRTLDGMLAGELLDTVEGGFFRYALEADWTEPRREKLLDVNAGLLSVYALGAVVRGRGDWADVATGIVEWCDRTLALPDGLWAGSQAGDSAYFTASREERADLHAPPIDATRFTTANARWIAALAQAGGRLQQPHWCSRAEHALDRLLADMAAPGDRLYHYRTVEGEPQLDTLAIDVVECARAALAVHQATGSAVAMRHAQRLAHTLEQGFWANEGGFYDRIRSPHDVGALRYQDRPFELNALGARLLLDLASATAQRGWRAHAEGILALLAPLAGRWGIAGATFATAVEQYFEPPVRVIVVGDPADAEVLRHAALALPLADHRVWSMPEGGRLDAVHIPREPSPALYVCTRRGCSPPITQQGELGEAAARLL